MEAHTASEINIIRGKWLAGHYTKDDVKVLLDHITALENFLDEADYEDTFGTEGWRHTIGLD